MFYFKTQLIFLFQLFVCISNAQTQVSSGKLEVYKDFYSKYVTARTIEVWLPEGYNSNTKYAVLYMHDGQMLFDSNTTWNKQSWEIDEMATKLMQDKNVKPFIVVGIYNGGKTRHTDYFPQKPYENLNNEEKQLVTNQLKEKGRIETDFKPISDNYLKFLVQELKPMIDKTYSVATDKENTFIMGSSMGGLISMYAMIEYPKVFGGAACLSTHWPGIFTTENNPIPNAFYQYLKKNIKKIKSNKIYFDYGDKTLDEMYPPLQKEVDSIFKNKGFKDKNWQTHFFEGEDHSEKAWSKRLDIPLKFLLKP
jgi:predicted alpha/beta superfamily hydrolase